LATVYILLITITKVVRFIVFSAIRSPDWFVFALTNWTASYIMIHFYRFSGFSTRKQLRNVGEFLIYTTDPFWKPVMTVIKFDMLLL